MKTQGKAQHTPGPWKILELETPIRGSDGSTVDSGLEIGAGLSENIATVGGLRNRAARAANAHLIAAAPELLDVSVEALHELESISATMEDHPTVQRLRAAIAKAEGR